ncbi:Malonate--CoA ligase [Escovopsis weberi]|uniref:Malonate--CoA ligase n=1 Tax=Escovopsis weberi TaxID=150374 RepID=A0A0N0RSV5_ESCWE|nr:Malonate--CoA ligase [Escovopsis weberi]
MAVPDMIFPNDPGLVRLLRSAKRCPGISIVADAFGFDKTYNELLADVLRTRDSMREHLPPSALDERALLRGDAPYVCILARAGYEFVVATFAIRALGGACIPIATGVVAEEAAYFVEISKSCCIMAGRDFLERADETVALLKEQKNFSAVSLPVSSDAKPLEDMDQLDIDEGLALDPAGPGLVIFTSGTTGKPKGVVLPRWGLDVLPDGPVGSESVCFRPPIWLGGFVGIIMPIAMGTKIHIAGERATAQQIWDLLLNNSISTMAFIPSMLRYLKEDLEARTPQEQEKIVGRFKLFKYLDVSGALLSPTVMEYWRSKTNLPFGFLYGSTEMGVSALVKMHAGTQMTNCIGVPVHESTKVKLSEGDHGEMMLKTPQMFLHYMGDEQATKAAFDEEGWYKTGDYAELRDGEYYFCGRASADYAFPLGLCVPTAQVEMALTSLPYIASACVLGVPDHEAKEVCAAVVRLAPATQPRQAGPDRVTLAIICEDLRPLIPEYMHPTVLRLIEADEDMPQTITGKPIKRLVVKKFFGVDEYWDAASAGPGVEWNGKMSLHAQGEKKPWVWAGLTIPGA